MNAHDKSVQSDLKRSQTGTRPVVLAKGGTPLMQSVQTIGIDLPLKVLVWEDSVGITWLSYNDPHWLARRHRLDNGVEKSVLAMATVLNAIVTAAGGSPS